MKQTNAHIHMNFSTYTVGQGIWLCLAISIVHYRSKLGITKWICG